jgi:Flp pilus assembly protein TadD
VRRTGRVPAGGRTLAAGLFLSAALLVLYWPLRDYGFVSYDLDTYLRGNAMVRRGLSGEGVRWAFTTFHGSNWHPLTWLSHMLDVQLFGLDPGPHHLANLLWHAAGSVLLLATLAGLTGRVWPAAAAALLFALHPLQVESVAWPAERKNLLAFSLWMLAILAYLRWVRGRRARDWWLTLAALAAGLMAKPMVVTAPFTLLLLDWWPLGRMGPGRGRWSWGGVLGEKAPFLLLAAVSSGVTYLAQWRGGSVTTLENIPLGPRLANALVSYALYLKAMLHPSRLAFFYPLPSGGIPAGTLLASAALLGVLAWGAWRLSRRHPFLLTGFLWYLGTLVPVLGVVQVGLQARADRYAQVPLAGVALAAAWLAADALPRRAFTRRALGPLLLAALLLGVSARRQLAAWSDDESLFRHALRVTRGNYVAHNNLGHLLMTRGRTAEAEEHLRRAVALNPDDVKAALNLGTLLGRTGRREEATRVWEDAARRKPRSPVVQNNLGIALAWRGDLRGAGERFREAVRLQGDYAEAWVNLGNLARREGRPGEAEANYRTAISLRPDLPDGHLGLGLLLLRQGQRGEARAALVTAASLSPPGSPAHQALAEEGGGALRP